MSDVFDTFQRETPEEYRNKVIHAINQKTPWWIIKHRFGISKRKAKKLYKKYV